MLLLSSLPLNHYEPPRPPPLQPTPFFFCLCLMFSLSLLISCLYLLFIYTHSAHTPDNSFMGFVSEELNETEKRSIQQNKVNNMAVVYGKEASMWKVQTSNDTHKLLLLPLQLLELYKSELFTPSNNGKTNSHCVIMSPPLLIFCVLLLSYVSMYKINEFSGGSQSTVYTAGTHTHHYVRNIMPCSHGHSYTFMPVCIQLHSLLNAMNVNTAHVSHLHAHINKLLANCHVLYC